MTTRETLLQIGLSKPWAAFFYCASHDQSIPPLFRVHDPRQRLRIILKKRQSSMSLRNVETMSVPDKFHTDVIVRNKNYESDLKYDLELNRILLKIIGVWPADLRRLTNFDRIIALLARFLTTFSLLFFMIPIACHVLFVEKDWTVKIQVLVTVNYCFEAVVKYAIVIVRNEEMKRCIDMIASDWREIHWTVCRSIMLENARSCRTFTTLFVTSGAVCVVIYHFIVPFVSIRSDTLRQNGTKLSPILYGTEFFVFDARVSPMRDIVYLGQTIGAMVMCTVNCAICTITVKFAMHACSRYQIVTALMPAIDNVGNNDDNDFKCQDAVQRRFAHVVRRHLYAIEFVPRIENALNGICFVSLAVSTVNICFIGYTLIMEWEKSPSGNIVTYALAATSFVSNIFVLCYCGEQLAEQCRQVSIAGYMTDWWNMQPHESRDLILMIAVSQFPVEFTAGKLFKLSLKTFCAVMKVAITYLNVLRTMIQFHE